MKARKGTDWAVGRRAAPFVVEQPTPFRPDLLVVYDRRRDHVVAFEPLEPGAPAKQVAAHVVARLPAPTRSRPVRVTIDDGALAAALRDEVLIGTDVAVGPTPEVDHLIAHFDAHEGHRRDRRRKWGFAPGTTDADLDLFYDVAGRFAALKPWKTIDPGQVVLFDVPSLGWQNGCASVLGAGGEACGVTLAHSVADYVAALRYAASGGPTALHERGPGVPLLTVYFERQRDLPGGKAQLAHARQHGFVAAPKARVPSLEKSGADSVPLQPGGEDLRIVLAVLGSLLQLLHGDASPFRAPRDRQVILESTLTLLSGTIEIRLTAPPLAEELPWHWGHEDPLDGIRRQTSSAVVLAFEESRRDAGASDAETTADGHAAFEMLEFWATATGEPLPWTAVDVQEFLLEFYPRRGSASGPDLEQHPARVERFLSWLDASGHVPAGSHDQACRAVAACRQRFLERASDRRRYGPAKLVALHAHQEGIDFDDPPAVDAFLERFNERLKADPSLLSSGERRKAWVWDGRPPAPDPKAPCPCGGDRRYRRCCMPR